MQSNGQTTARLLAPALNFIAGQWQGSDRPFAVFDKFTQEAAAQAFEASPEQVQAAIRSALEGFERSQLTALERSKILRKTAELLEQARSEVAEAFVAETGFTLADAAGDIDRTLVTLELCSEEAKRLTGETVSFAASAGQHNRIGYTFRAPLGVVCAITPFNSPLNTVAHKIGPALAAGNAVILKPSQLTPLSATILTRLLLEAGLPENMIQLVHGAGRSVGEVLLDAQEIAFYAFTGSTEVGRMIQAKAGIRRTQMELGSIASTIVTESADLALALPKIANAAFRKAGQVCTSVQRLYIHASVRDAVLQGLSDLARDMRAGDPRDPATRVGPMISEKEAARAESWIKAAQAGGADVLCGGQRERAVLQPTIVAGAKDGMNVVDREIFAPCLVALPFADLDAAIAHANNTPFGLAAGIFTSDVNAALQAARRLRFGAIHINETSSARGDAMPFGGVKESGFGHEGPQYAIREMSEERLVTFNPF